MKIPETFLKYSEVPWPTQKLPKLLGNFSKILQEHRIIGNFSDFSKVYGVFLNFMELYITSWNCLLNFLKFSNFLVEFLLKITGFLRTSTNFSEVYWSSSWNFSDPSIIFWKFRKFPELLRKSPSFFEILWIPFKSSELKSSNLSEILLSSPKCFKLL